MVINVNKYHYIGHILSFFTLKFYQDLIERNHLN